MSHFQKEDTCRFQIEISTLNNMPQIVQTIFTSIKCGNGLIGMYFRLKSFQII